MGKYAILLWGGMSEKFLKLIRSDYVLWLMGKYPWAYLLFNLIALRACRSLPNPDGLKLGESLIGDWDAIGATRGEYRQALKILEREKLIEIIETNRTRKKTTTGTTTEGTKVKLLDSRVWDINSNGNNHCNDHRATTEQPLNNHEEEYKEGISNDIPIKNIARTAPQPRSKDFLTFDFEKWEFSGVMEKDLEGWKLMYPHIDLKVETLKAAQWLKNNPSKSHKKQWRKYLTGWFQRSNDSIENKKAYQSAKSSTGPDRRTKDSEGNPVENQYKGKF
jgi:hypothetical protein